MALALGTMAVVSSAPCLCHPLPVHQQSPLAPFSGQTSIWPSTRMASAPAPSPFLLQAPIASRLVGTAASSSGFHPPPCPLRTVLFKPIQVCLFLLRILQWLPGCSEQEPKSSQRPPRPHVGCPPLPSRVSSLTLHPPPPLLQPHWPSCCSQAPGCLPTAQPLRSLVPLP